LIFLVTDSHTVLLNNQVEWLADDLNLDCPSGHTDDLMRPPHASC
jgi:hypothetical protein